MTYEKCFDVFEPIFPDLLELVENAFSIHYELHRNEIEVITCRTRSSEINDRIVAGLPRLMESIGNVEIIRYHGVRMIRVPGTCILRIKKLDSLGRAAYRHTHASLLFDNNMVISELPTEDRLYFGYVLDNPTEELRDVLIAAPSRGEFEPADWMIKVNEELAKQGQFFRRQSVSTLEPKLIPKIAHRK